MAGITPVPPAEETRHPCSAAKFRPARPAADAGRIDAFLADEAPDAFARLVDRLLASPQYGQRWGRYWLDVARYADSNGQDENLAYVNAYRYRDYVIDAFNVDKPYDQFIREQIAGDLLPDAASDAERHECLIATGFLTLGPKMLAEDDPVKMQMDIVDEQVDAIGGAFLGLTLGARCHDHKFDPISMADYYGLAGILKSTKTMDNFKVVAQWHERPLATAEEVAKVSRMKRPWRRRRPRSRRLTAARILTPMRKPAWSKNSRRSKKRAPPRSRRPWPWKTVSRRTWLSTFAAAICRWGPWFRGFPAALGGRSLVAPAASSGRLELAQWITDARHPLTVARVMANRVWRWHFGAGILRRPTTLATWGTAPRIPSCSIG